MTLKTGPTSAKSRPEIGLGSAGGESFNGRVVDGFRLGVVPPDWSFDPPQWNPSSASIALFTASSPST